MREGFRASASTSVDTSFRLCDRITFGSPKLDPTTPQNLEERENAMMLEKQNIATT